MGDGEVKSFINVYCDLCSDGLMFRFSCVCFDVLQGQINFPDKIVMHINLLHPLYAEPIRGMDNNFLME